MPDTETENPAGLELTVTEIGLLTGAYALAVGAMSENPAIGMKGGEMFRDMFAKLGREGVVKLSEKLAVYTLIAPEVTG